MTTKDKILFAALDLFSEKGYDGVGVDQIAESIGLKGPSIYRHFKGKEDILNRLIAKGTEHYNESIKLNQDLKRIPASASELKEMSLKQIEFTMSDPMIIKFRKVISMEQFRNEIFAQLATDHNVTQIENMYSFIFEKMIENGSLKEDNPQALAVEYTYPISLFIQMSDRHPEKSAEIKANIINHIDRFIKMYAIK